MVLPIPEAPAVMTTFNFLLITIIKIQYDFLNRETYNKNVRIKGNADSVEFL